MGKADDPEKMLAEALRAQAARSSGPDPAALPTSPVFELISGSEFGGPPQPGTRALPEHPEPEPEPRPGPSRLGTGVLLLLAVMLGLACGAVAGLLTVL